MAAQEQRALLRASCKKATRFVQVVAVKLHSLLSSAVEGMAFSTPRQSGRGRMGKEERESSVPRTECWAVKQRTPLTTVPLALVACIGRDSAGFNVCIYV